jgi:hypothetical protein
VKHVVQYGGGVTSWLVARRLVDEHGPENVVVLFADVKAEDEDLYRFNADVEGNLGLKLTVVCDGRTPQQVLRDVRWIGTAKVAPCSHLLKQVPCREWLTANTDPADTVLYVAIAWWESDRLPAIQKAWAPWTVEAPLCDPPYLDKRACIDEVRRAGMVEPRLYALGYEHNNCGGTCVRAGQGQWAHTLRVFPERFASWEQFEQEQRAKLGDYAMLRDRRGGTTKPLPLTVLRSRVEESAAASPPLFDADDWGGCGCFVDGDAA